MTKVTRVLLSVITIAICISAQLDQPTGTSYDVATGDVVRVGVFEGGTAGIVVDSERNRTSLSVSVYGLGQGVRYQVFGNIGVCDDGGPRLITSQGIPFWVGLDTDASGIGKGVATHPVPIDLSPQTGVSSISIFDESKPSVRVGCSNLFPPSGTMNSPIQRLHPQLQITECEYGEVGEGLLPFIEVQIASGIGNLPPEIEIEVTAHRGTCTSPGSVYLMDPVSLLMPWNSLSGSGKMSVTEGGVVFALGTIAPRILRPEIVIISYEGVTGCCAIPLTPSPSSTNRVTPPPLVVGTPVPNKPIDTATVPPPSSQDDDIFSPSWKLVVTIVVLVVVLVVGVASLYCIFHKKKTPRDPDDPSSPSHTRHPQLQPSHYLYSVSPEKGPVP